MKRSREVDEPVGGLIFKATSLARVIALGVLEEDGV